ncbi:MAG TPA: hypothetical protein VL181_04145 [Holophagaceae bacterium]|nr:hypothetical protein [Holophagaceae bacterium]
MDQPYTAIRLDTDGECPYCGRPILGLAHDRCDGCGRSIEGVFESLPSVASRLDEIAQGWTVERLKAWASPLPAHLARAYQSLRWKNLGWWAEEALWEGWARTEMSLRGRGQALQLDQVRVERAQMAGLDSFHPFVDIRMEGTRSAFLFEPASGRLVGGTDAPRPFKELWTLRHTGRSWPSEMPPCASCGAGLPLEEAVCPHCRTPVQPSLGPWSVIRLWPLDAQGELVNQRPGGAGIFDGLLDALVDGLMP